MIGRFIDYNCLITYLGNFNKDSFSESLANALGKGPRFIPRINQDITMLEYRGIKMLKINILYYIEKGMFSDEEKEDFNKQLRSTIKEDLEKELKAQKIMYNFESE